MKWETKTSKSNTKRKKTSRSAINCTVFFLDNSTQIFRLPADSKGIHLLMLAYKHEGLFETKYFGLQFSPKKNSLDKVWLLPYKSLSKQFKCSSGDVELFFEVKFFPDYPSQLEDKQSSDLIFEQLWRNIRTGKLHCQLNTASLLTSYYLQVTSGDFLSEAQDLCNLSHLHLSSFIPKAKYSQVIELHKLLRGLSSDHARKLFLDHVKRLELYGVDLHAAKDAQGKSLTLGISSKGIVVYCRDVKMNTFSWSKIVKIYYKGERFFIQLFREQPDNFDTVVGFFLDNRHRSKLLWNSCIEFHAFYFTGTSPNYQRINKGVFPKIRKIIKNGSCYTISHCAQPSTHNNETWMGATYRRYDQLNKIQSISYQITPRKAWTSSSNTSIIKSGHDVLESTQSDIHSIETSPPEPLAAAFVPSNLDQTIYFADDDVDEVDNRLPLYLETLEEDVDYLENTVHVELDPDASGRFGFNVRFQGENQPASISRIIPNSPADFCYPPIRLGDQLLTINGRLVNFMTQQEVVTVLQDAKYQKLHLTLQRSGCCDNTDTEEQPMEYVMDEQSVSLPQSISDVIQGLRTGSILSAFELLCRQRMELSCKEAKTDENIKKNRYGDIFPYDYNRVALQSSPYGDYINASHITMKICEKIAPVRYIATQGPLPHTVEDFWCLVWDYDVSVVAMVTPEFERGTLKCHRYWPELGETVHAGDWVINCLGVVEFPSFLQREFIINNLANQEVRRVVQVKYADWPDHGVPVSASHFTEFVRHVQQVAGQTQNQGHIVVHCSAGIGRTGAFILLDTAIRCLSNGVPVDPLRLVRTMRDQRPLMVQTSSQFRYVCECIVDVARTMNL